jgi:hypothetical protein
MSKVQIAIDFALSIANNNLHGYDQAHRTTDPDELVKNSQSTDCSGLVIAAFAKAGIKVREAGATYTGNMKKAFLSCGFVEMADKVGLTSCKGMVPGDVLLHEGKHTALYIGNGQLVHASINEKGEITGGLPGDQTGKEICVRSYYNHPWNSVLRYIESFMTFEQAIDFHARNSGVDKNYWLVRKNIDPFFAEFVIKTAHN